jgi:hypothetical protein
VCLKNKNQRVVISVDFYLWFGLKTKEGKGFVFVVLFVSLHFREGIREANEMKNRVICDKF